MGVLKLDAYDYEYLTGKSSYAFELPADETEVVAAISGSDEFSVSLECSKEEMVDEGTGEVMETEKSKEVAGQLYPVFKGSAFRHRIRSKRFNCLHIQTKKTTQLAVQLVAMPRGEILDPTPISVTIATEKEMTLKEAVRQAIFEYQQMSGKNVDPDDFDLDPFDGDFDDDEVEGVSAYQVREMQDADEVPVVEDEDTLPPADDEGEAQPEDVEDPPEDGA